MAVIHEQLLLFVVLWPALLGTYQHLRSCYSGSAQRARSHQPLHTDGVPSRDVWQTLSRRQLTAPPTMSKLCASVLPRSLCFQHICRLQGHVVDTDACETRTPLVLQHQGRVKVLFGTSEGQQIVF